MSGLAATRVLVGCEPATLSAPVARAGRVVLLEASHGLGGKVETGAVGGQPVELGPDQFLRRDPSGERLCRLLGLGGDLVEPAARSAAVFARGRLRPLPAGLVLGVPSDLDSLGESGVVSEEAVERLRTAGAPQARPTPAEAGLADGPGEERSAADLLRPRLGDEVLEVLVDPLLGGINAGRIEDLSLGLTAPVLAEALVAGREIVPAARPSAGGASPFYGLSGGLSRLVAATRRELEAGGAELRLGTRAVTVRRRACGFEVETAAGDVISAAAVVLAVPAFQAAGLVAEISAEAARELAAIDYASVAVCTYALPPAASVPSGVSGFLVPRREGMLMTAGTFLSEKWPWMRRDGVLVRLSAGRAGDERIAGMRDDELADRLRREFADVTGVREAPTAASVRRWERSFPQYAPGHRRRVGTIRHLLERDGLALAGALLGGIGIPACISSGERAAASVSSLSP